MKINDVFDEINLIIRLNNKKEIGISISKMLRVERLIIMIVLATVKNLLVKNKEGIHLGFLCHTLSAVVSLKSDIDFCTLINQLIKFGFLSVNEFLDENGDDDANINLGNSKIGDYAECDLIKAFPTIKALFDHFKSVDIEELKRNSRNWDEGNEEVRH